jgi:glycine betaine/choline ABC-type transport system substrate-binding protein
MILAALAAGLLALAIAACGGEEETGGGGSETTAGTGEVEPIEEDPANKGTSLTIGSKNFTEQFVLGEIYAQALEAAGFEVETEFNLGSEQIAYKALKSGQIDAYPEYTGTALTSFFGFDTDEVPTEAENEKAYELAKEEYAKAGITAPAQAPFNNTYILASTAETAEKLGNPQTTTELVEAEGADELSIAGFPECRQRTDCLLGLRDIYGYEPEFVSTEAQYEALENGDADLLFAFGTDGALSTDKYYTYEDDKELFRSYHIVFSMRDETAEEIGPEGIDIIERVQEPLTEEVMRELNARVDLDKQKPDEVATQYLQEAGFIE